METYEIDAIRLITEGGKGGFYRYRIKDFGYSYDTI